MTRRLLAIVFSILDPSLTADAQEMITDRPDFTESAVVIPANMVQIESGAEYADLRSREEFSYPNALARIGIGYNLEIRFGFSGWIHLTENAESENHFNDLLLEAKYQITNAHASVPMAILLVSTLPTGDSEVSVGRAELGVIFAISHELDDRLGLAVNLGAVSVDDGEGRELLALASLALGVGLSDHLGAFVEGFAEMPQGEPWQPVLDGGLTFLVMHEAQLDLYLGKGLNARAGDWRVGAGVSFRFGY